MQHNRDAYKGDLTVSPLPLRTLFIEEIYG